tara:strand:- start:894 stop:1157 length:264 start_codon:yes stop_codon:yes gene_type:complete
MKITEFTKMVKHLTELSSTINYYMIEQEQKDFEEWLLTEYNIELKEDFETHIDELIENDTIHEGQHIYLTIRESEKYIDKLQNKINI